MHELRALSMVVDIPVKKIVAQIKPHADDPLTPVVLRRGIHTTSSTTSRSTRSSSPACSPPTATCAATRTSRCSRRCSATSARSPPAELKAAESAGYTPQDVMGQAGIEQSYDRYLKGTDGSDQLTVNSLGPADEPDHAEGPSAAREHAEADDRRRPPAGRREGAARRGIADRAAARRDLRRRRRDRRARPAHRRGARARLEPDLPAVGVRQPRPVEAGAAPEREGGRGRRTTPGLDRAIDGFYPPGSVWKPVTALAAMEEGILSPTTPLHCSPDFVYYQQPFTNWDPYVNQPMELTQALAESCDTYFYQVGAQLLQPARRPRPDAAALGVAVRLRRADRDRHRARERGARPDAGLAVQGVRRPAVRTSTGSGSPATRSSSRSARATSR